MVTLALALVLAADAASETKELKIAAPGLVVTGLQGDLSAPLTDQLAKPFAPIRVVTPRDIAAVLGLERQKELLGCASSGACMAELGNALGVQGVLLGDIVKLGDAIQINARIIDPLQGRGLATASERITGEGQLFDALTRVGLQLRAQFYSALGVTAPLAAATDVTVSQRSSGTRRFFPIPGIVGVVGVGLGVAFYALSEGAYGRLTTGALGSVSAADAPQIAQNGNTYQLASAALLTVGIVALAAGLYLLLFGSRGDST